MSRLRLRLVPHAVDQLDEADRWWRQNREKAPDLLMTELVAGIDLLRESPEVGAPYPNEHLPDVKRFLLRRTRFHVYTSCVTTR